MPSAVAQYCGMNNSIVYGDVMSSQNEFICNRSVNRFKAAM